MESTRDILSSFFRTLGLPVRNSLPGKYPQTLTRASLRAIKSTPLVDSYFVAPKTDGERCMVFVRGLTTWLIDRRLTVTRLYVANEPVLEGDTVFDCELVDATHSIIVFDILAIRGERISNMPYDQRLCTLVTPEQLAAVVGPTLSASLKRVYPVRELSLAWDAARTSAMPCDGLIFTPSSSNLTCYKWKLPGTHTVDVEVRRPFFDHTGHLVMHCLAYDSVTRAVQGVVYQTTQITREEHAMIAPYDRCIVEMAWFDGRWRIKKVRTDKNKPNFIHVIVNCLEAEADHIDSSELLN